MEKVKKFNTMVKDLGEDEELKGNEFAEYMKCASNDLGVHEVYDDFI